MNRTLLVLDDDHELLRLFERVMGRFFGRIHVTSSWQAAEELLATQTITHLVVDDNLGGDQPRGRDLLARWSPHHPELSFRALFTGEGQAKETELDPIEIYKKPMGFSKLVERLIELVPPLSTVSPEGPGRSPYKANGR